jgi:hypothetical protein
MISDDDYVKLARSAWTYFEVLLPHFEGLSKLIRSLNN